MVPDGFPRKEDFPGRENVSDEEWIEYCISVWCCNSLNARAGALRYEDPYTANLLLRAQFVIDYLRQRSK